MKPSALIRAIALNALFQLIAINALPQEPQPKPVLTPETRLYHVKYVDPVMLEDVLAPFRTRAVTKPR